MKNNKLSPCKAGHVETRDFWLPVPKTKQDRVWMSSYIYTEFIRIKKGMKDKYKIIFFVNNS